MLSALLIVFREVIEAGLIVGIVLAATKGVPRRDFAVSLGVLAGVLGACLVAAFAGGLRPCSRARARNCSTPRSCFWR